MAHPNVPKSSGLRSQAAALVLIRICAGTFMFFSGVEKASWLLDSTPLATQLSSWLIDAPPISRWFLERIMPGTPVFARLIPVGSLLGGVALAFGFWTRMAAALSLLMVWTLQLAAGSMFKYEYLADADGLPLAGAMVGLIIGGGRLPFSLRR
jgi:uncharacterized membrane protein YphA (DoxX/SURF4 family)